MKTVLAWCVFLFAAVIQARPDEKYTDRYDNTNVDEILSNKRLLENYFKCIMNEGKCTPQGEEIKLNMVDALETECSKCTDIQKEISRKVIKHLINHEKELWDRACAKYDPDRKYATKYEKELKEAEG